MTPKIFKTQHRVSFLDLDPFNHLNTLPYIRTLLDHRFQAVRENLGWDLETMSRLPFILLVTRLEVSFLKPLLPDEVFTVESKVTEVMETQCRVTYEVFNSKQRLTATASNEFVCISKESQRPMTWPTGIMDLFFEAK